MMTDNAVYFDDEMEREENPFGRGVGGSVQLHADRRFPDEEDEQLLDVVEEIIAAAERAADSAKTPQSVQVAEKDTATTNTHQSQ